MSDNNSVPLNPQTTEGAEIPMRYSSLEFWHHLLVVLLVVLTGLHFGASFLIPLLFALLIFVLLIAIIDWFGKHMPPRICSKPNVRYTPKTLSADTSALSSKPIDLDVLEPSSNLSATDGPQGCFYESYSKG